MRRVAIGAIALALLASCGSRVRDWDEQLAGPAVRVTVTTAGEPETATTATTSPADDGLQPSRPTTTLRSVANTGSLPSPKPGRYVYDVTTTYPADEDGPAETEEDSELLDWRVTAAGDAVTTESVFRYPDDDGSFTSAYRTTKDRFELVSETSQYEDDTGTCRYTPALLVLQLPFVRGKKWQTVATCDDDGEARRVTVVAEVLGPTTDRIGSLTVNGFAVKSVVTTTSPDPEDPEAEPYTDRLELTTHYDPATLLVLVEDTVDTDSDDPEYVITEHRRLRSVTPQ